MAIRVIVVSRRTRDPLVDAADAYLKRIARHVKAEAVQVETGRRARGRARGRGLDGEAEALLRQVGAAQLIALDAGGRSYSSEQFARRLEQWLVRGDVAFVVGGADGLHGDVLARAAERLSLGRMTLPHRLARLVLCEQLYRALAILHNEPYHH